MLLNLDIIGREYSVDRIIQLYFQVGPGCTHYSLVLTVNCIATAEFFKLLVILYVILGSLYI